MCIASIYSIINGASQGSI